MSKVEDNSKISININLNVDKQDTNQVVGGRIGDKNMIMKVNPIPKQKKTKKKLVPDTQIDSSNISQCKENEKARVNGQTKLIQAKQQNINKMTFKQNDVVSISDVLKQIDEIKRSSITPQTHAHSFHQNTSVMRHNVSTNEARLTTKVKKNRTKSGQKKKQVVIKPQINITARTDVQQQIKTNLKNKKWEELNDKSMQLLMDKEREVKKREVDVQNQEIRLQNASRFSKPRTRSKPQRNMQIPWGLDQERLKSYLLQQVLQNNNNLLMQQMKKQKQVEQKQHRRQESLLRQQEDNLYVKIKQPKPEAISRMRPSESEDIIQYLEWKKRGNQINEDQRKQDLNLVDNSSIADNHTKSQVSRRSRSQSEYMPSKRQPEYEEKLIELSMLQPVPERQKVSNKKKKKRLSGKKVKDGKKHKLVIKQQFSPEKANQMMYGQNLTPLPVDYNQEADEQMESQRIDEIDTSFFSDGQYQITNQDDQFSMPTLGLQEQQIRKQILQDDDSYGVIKVGPDSILFLDEFDEEEAREMAEIRQIEQDAVLKNMKSVYSLDFAANIIQKHWRGYNTRKIVSSYLQQQAEEQQYNSKQQYNLENLSESQIEELVRLGYLQVDDDGMVYPNDDIEEEQQIEQQAQNYAEINYSEASQKSQRLQRTFDDTKREPSSQAQGANMIFDAEAYSNYIQDDVEWDEESPEQDIQQQIPEKQEIETTRKQQEDLKIQLEEQKQKWNDMLTYVAGLEREGSKVDISEALQNIKRMSEKNQRESPSLSEKKQQSQKNKRSLIIDVEKIEEEYNQQDEEELPQQQIHPDIDLSEMRLVMGGSESLVKDYSKSSDEKPLQDSSIFEQTPFKEFTGKKFKEMLKRENMDSLVKLREQVLEDRKSSQGKKIQDMLSQQRISPKTFNKEWLKLEKWVTKEREELKERKKEMEKGWRGTYDTVLKTQRDLMFMQKNQHEGNNFTILANSFSYEHISNKYVLSGTDDIHIKVIDNYHSDLSSEYQISPNKDLILSQEIKREIIDIQLQNQALQEKYINYEKQQRMGEEDLDEEIVFDVMNFLPGTILDAPHSSPTPSPKYHNRSSSPNDSREWNLDDNDDKREVTKLGQSIKLCQIVASSNPNHIYHKSFFEESTQPSVTQQFNYFNNQPEFLQVDDEITEKQASSYAIIITNILIEQEVQALYQDMLKYGIDIIDVVNRNTYINHQINNKKMTSEKRIEKQQKGIKTNLSQVKQYLSRLIAQIQEKYQDQLIKQINIPIGPSSKEMLKYLHYDDYNSQSSQHESSIDSSYQHSAILNTELFADMERILVEDQFIKQSHEFLLELEHIHNKIIFDAVNEALDIHRPYALNGQPFPWKVDAKKLPCRQIGPDQIKSILKSTENQVIEWAQCFVGIIIDKEDSPFPKMLMFDPEYLNQIKEDRLLRMLSEEIILQEERWINYDEESTEIQVEMADIVYDHLICEFVQELYKNKIS